MAEDFNIIDTNSLDQNTLDISSSNPPTTNVGYRNEFNNPAFQPIQNSLELQPPDFEGEYNAEFLNAVERATAFNNIAPGGMSNYPDIMPGMATTSYDPLQQSMQNIDTSTAEGRKADLLHSFDKVSNDFRQQDPTPGLEDPFFFGIKRHNADRYYKQPAFNRLGFHPMQDNESYYTANTGFYNNFVTTGTQWANMFGTQVIAPYRSIGDLFRGDFLDPDEVGGGVMHEAMRLAGSQNGGFGGWLNDFLLNSAFSFGTLFNIAMEEVVMAAGSALATTPTGGYSWVPFAARTAHNFKRGMKATSAIFNLKDLYGASAKMLNQIRSVEKARDAYTAMKTGATITADIFTPSITHAIRKLNTASGTANGLSNMAKASIAFGGFYRQARALNLALSEGKIEAGLVEINMKDKLYRQWREENPNKANPDEKELDKIHQFSREAAWETTQWNIPIIYLSNRFVFSSAMKGFSSFKQAAINEGKRRGKTLGQSRLAKEASRPYVTLGEGFSALYKKGFKEGVTPAALGGLYYIQANLAEGFQELAQESLAVGIEDYYTKLYNEPIAFSTQTLQSRIHGHTLQGREEWLSKAYDESWDVGAKSHMNWKGFGVFMSGFMMGGMMQSAQTLMKSGYDLYQEKADPEAFNLYKDRREAIQNADRENLNDMWQDLDTYLGEDLQNLIYQQQQQSKQTQAQQNNDRQSYEDSKFDSITRKLESLFATGKQGDFRARIKDELKMTDDELSTAYPGETPTKKRQRLEKMLKNLDQYEKTWNEFSQRFVTDANPLQYKIGTPEFQLEQSRLKMHDFMKRLAIFTNMKFTNTIERTNSIAESFSSDPVFSKIDAFDIDLLLGTEKHVKDQISLLEDDIKNSEPKTEQDKLILRQKQEKLKLIKTFAGIKFNPNNLVDGVFQKQKAELLVKPVTNYLKHVAEVKNDYVLSEKIEDAIVKMVDHQWLDAMSGMYHDAAAYLINPKRLYQLAEKSAPIHLKIFESQRTKNKIKKDVTNGIARNEKIIFMNILAQNAIEGNEEQVAAFLESDENNIPDMWRTPDGPLTAETQPVKWNLLQQFIQTYLKKSIIEDNKTDLDTQDESDIIDATDLTDSEREAIDKQEKEVDEQQKLDEDFLLTDKNIEEILDREHSNYAEEQQLSGNNVIGKVHWGRGKAITRARRQLHEKYIELTTPEQREKIEFDAWLNKNVGRRYEVSKILDNVNVGGMLYKLKLKEIVSVPAKNNLESSGWRDKNLDVQVVKIENADDDPFWQVKYKGKDVSDIMGSSTIKNAEGKSIKVEKRYYGKDKAGVDAESRAEIAAKAFVEHLKNASTVRDTFEYDGVKLYPGQNIYNVQTKKEYQVSTKTKPEEIKRGKVLVIYPLEGEKPSTKTSIEVPQEGFSERYNTGTIEHIIESTPKKKVVNTGTTPLMRQFNFFPFRPSKLKPGDPFYDKKEQEAAVQEQKEAQQAGTKPMELETFDEFVTTIDLSNKKDREDIKIKITKKEVKPANLKIKKESSGYYSEPVSSPYEIHLKHGDVPRAVFTFNAPNLFRPDGTKINPVNITRDEVLKLFNVKDIQDKQDIAKIVQDKYITNNIIVEALDNFKGDLNQDFTLDQFLGDVLNNKIDVSLNPGYLTFNSAEAQSGVNKFNDLKYNTVDGENFLIFDIQKRFVINKKGNRVLEKSDRDPIHSFGQDVSKRKRIEKEARKHMNAEDGYTTSMNLGRYVAAVKFPNGTWTFVELKGSKMERSDIEDLLFGKFTTIETVEGEDKTVDLNGLLQRQQETVANNTKKVKVELEDGTETEGLEAKDIDYNKNWNRAFQDKFYLSGKQGDIIQIGLSNTGVIRVFKSNKKNNKRQEEIYLNHRDIDQLKKDYADRWNQDKLNTLLSYFNGAFDQFQRKKKENNKNFVPYTLDLKPGNFRNSIPKNATPMDLMDATAVSSKEVRSHISFNFITKTEEDIDAYRSKEQVISDNKNTEQSIEDSAETSQEQEIVGVELTNNRFEEWLNNPVNLYEDEDDKKILENIAWKQQENIALSPQEEEIYTKHIGEITTISNELESTTDMSKVIGEDAVVDTTALENEYDKKEQQVKEREGYYFKGDGREQIIVDLIKSGTIKGSVVSDNVEDGFAYELEDGDFTKEQLILINTTANQRFDQDRKNGELAQLKQELTELENRLNEQEFEADKIVDDFDGDDVQDWYYIERELDKILPSWIQRKEIAYIKNQAISRNLTAGKMVMYLHNLSQDIQGTIYTTPIERIAYHEAFHAVFRLFLTDEQRAALYKESIKKARSLMRSKNGYNMGTKNNPHVAKSMEEAREVMRLKKSEYAQMDDSTLNELIAEELMADQFAIFKLRPRSKRILDAFKSVFNKMVEVIKQVIRWFGNNGSNDVGITLNRLYKDIERGKYVNSTPADNQLVRALRLGKTEELTAYKIKMGDKLKVKKPIIVNGQKVFKTRIIDKYFPADQADVMKRTIAYYVTDITKRNEEKDTKAKIELLKSKWREEGVPQDEWQTPTIDSIIEQAVDMYIDLYDPNSMANKSRDDFNDIATSLWEYYLSLQSAKDNIIEAVTKDITENDYEIVNDELDQNESDVDQVSPEIFQKSSNETGGRNQLKNNRAIREWISSIGIAQEDMFGNKIINPNAPEDQQRPLMAQVNAKNVFDGLLKITEGIALTDNSSENIRRILQKIYEGSKAERQTKAAVRSLFKRIGLSYELDGPKLSSNEYTFIDKLKDKYFLTTILNVFHQNRINPQIIQKDVNAGGIRIIEAGGSSDTDWQLKLWNTEYNKKIPQDGSSAKLIKLNNIDYTGKEEAVDVLDAIIQYYTSQKLDESTLLDESFENGYKKLSDRLFASTGIRISPTTIRFNVLQGVLDENNIAPKELTNDQQSFLNAYPNVNPISSEIFSEIRGAIVSDVNLFQAWVEVKNDDNDKVTQYVDERVGVSGRLVQLARVNSKFDETVGSSVYLTADGKMVYLHTLPSLNSEFVLKLNNEEYLDELRSDPYLEDNALLNSSKFERMSKDELFLLNSVSGVQSKYLEIENGRYVAKAFREQNKEPGTTAGKLSPLQIAAITYNYYLINFNNRTGEVKTFDYIDPADGKQKKGTWGQIIPRIQSDSNQIESVPVPIEEAIKTDAEGNIIFTPWLYANINNILKIEYDEAVKQQIHFNNPNADVIKNYERIEGFNMEQDQRGFSFEHASWLTIASESQQQKTFVSKRISRSIPKIENGELLKRIIAGKQKVFIRPEQSGSKYGLAVGRSAIARMIVDKKSVDYKITNKGLMQIGVDEIDYDTIKEQLGESYFTTEEGKAGFDFAIPGKDEGFIYTNNKSIQKFLMGDVKRYIYEVEKIDLTEEKETTEEAVEKDTTLLDALKQKIRLGENAPTWEQALKEIKITNPGYDVNSIAERHLRNEFTKHLNLLSKLKLDDFDSPLNRAFHTTLVATDPSVSADNINESLKRLNLKENNLNHNLAQVYFWHHMQNIQLNRIRLGNQSKMFGKAKEFVKRAKDPKAVNSFIPYSDVEKGIQHPLDKFHALIYSEPQRSSKYTTKNKWELQEDTKAPQTKINDSQLYLTLKGFLYLMYGTSKLTNDQQNLIERLMNGENVSDSEILGSVNRKGLAKRQSILSAQKPVYKGDTDQVLLKMAAFTLTPHFTSFKVGDKWVAKNKKMDFLHNLREQMEQSEKENDTIIVAGPESMSKQKTTEVVDYKEIENGNFILSDNISSLMELNAKNFRMQQTVPTNKQRVTKPTQIQNTITNEQDHSIKIKLDNGEDTTVGTIVKDYHANVNHRSKVNFIAKQNLLFSFEEAMWEVHESMNIGKITPELYNMLESARAGLKESQAKSQILEFFSIDEKGRPKWELNNTITVEDFENYFMNFFNKGAFSATQAGHNSVLISGHGYAKYKEVVQVDENGFPIQWRVVRDSEIQRRFNTGNFSTDLFGRPFLDNVNEDWNYDEVQSKINDGIELDESEKLKPGMIYTDRLRHGVIHWIEKNGKWIDSGNRVSEIVMPAHFRYITENLEDGEFIPNMLAKQIMVRIPTQDKQMTASAMIVDFMDSWQGSSVIAPDELIEIAGWDFDVDKVFQHVKDWYYNFGIEDFVEYGSRKDQLAYVDYIRWGLREMKTKGSVVYEGYQKWKAGTTKPERQRVVQQTSKEIQRLWNDWINEEVELIKDGRKIGSVKRKEISNFNLETSRLDFAKRFGYWYDKDNKQFGDQYEPIIRITEKSSDGDIMKFIESNESIALKGALSKIGYPISYDDVNEKNNYVNYRERNNGLEPYEAAISNKILDNEFILLGNRGITEPRGDRENPIGSDPATLTSLYNRFYDISQKDESKEHFADTVLEDMEVDNIDATIRAWISNKDISVGRAVTPTQSANILTEFKAKVRKKNSAGNRLPYFSFNNIAYTDFAIEYIVDPITNKFNSDISERKNDVMSAFISLMVDNANELLAAPLGMNRDATATSTILTGLGVDPLVSILFAINPTIYGLYDQAKNKVKPDDPSFTKLLSQKRNEVLNLLGIALGKAEYNANGYVEWKGGDFAKREANKQSVEDGVLKTKLTVDIMYKFLGKGNINEGKDLKAEELKELLQILTQWQNARSVAEIGFDLNAISSLTNQAPTTKEDRISANEVIIDMLGLEKSDKEFNSSDISIDLRPVLNPDVTAKKSPINYKPFLAGFYSRYKVLTQNLLPAAFLRETAPFKKLIDLVVENKTKNFKVFGTKQKNQVNKDVLAYLQAEAYRNRLRIVYPKLETSLNNGLIYHDVDGPIKIKTILDDINTWLKTAGREGSKKSNYLFDKYLFYNSHLNLNNGTGLDMAIFNNSVDLSNDEWTKISNSVLDLYGSGNVKIKRNILHLVNYLIVKDGLMFNRNSFLQAFEPVVLEDLLQSDKSVLNLFKKKRPSDNDFKSVFSLTFQELSENLIDVLNKKHSAAFEMETIEGTRIVEDIQWETTTKKIDMSFADKMIESNDTHIYVVADDTKNTGTRDIKDNAGVDNLFSIPFAISQKDYFNDEDFKINREIINEAIKKIEKAARRDEGRTIVFHYDAGKSGIMTPQQIKRIRSKSPRTLSYIEQEVARRLGYDLIRGKSSYERQKAVKSLPATIDGKKLLLNSLAGTSANIPEITDDSIKTAFTNIRIDKLYERDEKGNLIYGKDLSKAKKFFKKNNIQEVKVKQYKTRKDDISLSLYKFPLYLRDFEKNPYTGKVTSKSYKLVRVYLDPQSSTELKKQYGYDAKGTDSFYNINKENFLDDMAIGWAAEYVEVEGFYSNQQTNIAGMFPGEKLYEVITDERKVKQAEYLEEEAGDLDDDIGEDSIGFKDDVKNNSAELTQAEGTAENKQVKKFVYEGPQGEVSEQEDSELSKYSIIEQWEDNMGNLDIMEWYQDSQNVNDFVEDFKKMQKINPSLTQEQYLEQIEESYKCRK